MNLPIQPVPAEGAAAPDAPAAGWTRVHERRLRDMYRSAGWPCQDLVELELLAGGLLARVQQAGGRETLRVTDAGVDLLARTLQRNRARRDPHEQLVERVAREMTRSGRLAWRGLSLRAWVPGPRTGSAPAGGLLLSPESPTPLADATQAVAEPARPMNATAQMALMPPPIQPAELPTAGHWAMAMPDVFSVRHTTVEAYLEPVVHEIKVSRADLLGDLKRQAKRAAYLQLSSQCWYVLRAGIAEPEEIPLECGVMFATATDLEVARPAPRRAMRPSFDLWMALARATPLDGWRHEHAQAHLGEEGADAPGHGPGPDPSDQPTDRADRASNADLGDT